MKQEITEEVGSRRLDLRSEMRRYLNNQERGKAIGLIKKTRNREDRTRLKNQYNKWFDLQKLGKIPEKPFFMDMVFATPEVAAKMYEDKLKRSSPELWIKLNTTLRRFRSLNTSTFRKERLYIQRYPTRARRQ